MTRPFLQFALVGALLSTTLGCTPPSEPTAAEAIATKDGKIAAVGSIEDMKPWIGNVTRVLDMNGATIRPGLVDSHTHVPESGATVTFNSENPGSDHSIFYGLHSAITRQDKSSEPEGGWYPEEAFTIGEAIRAYTTLPAYASFRENETGILIFKGNLKFLGSGSWPSAFALTTYAACFHWANRLESDSLLPQWQFSAVSLL